MDGDEIEAGKEEAEPIPAPTGLRRPLPQPLARGLIALIATVSALVITAAFVTPSGFGTEEPGPVFALSGEVTGTLVVDTDDNPTDGTFSFLTVRVTEMSQARYLWGRLLGEDMLQLGAFGAVDETSMTRSRDTAAALAARYLSTPETLTAGALVVDVTPGSPADTAGIIAGNQIVAVDGSRTLTADALVTALQARNSNDTVRVLVAGVDGTVERTVAFDEDGRVGINVVSYVISEDGTFDIPDSDVSGESAGLLMSLAFIDAGSPGDLAAGLTVTGTGTVDRDGSVGPIGGADHKLAAAESIGADVFFVPDGNLPAVIDIASDVEVVPVETVDDALNWLCDAGATDAVCDTRSR